MFVKTWTIVAMVPPLFHHWAFGLIGKGANGLGLSAFGPMETHIFSPRMSLVSPRLFVEHHHGHWTNHPGTNPSHLGEAKPKPESSGLRCETFKSRPWIKIEDLLSKAVSIPQLEISSMLKCLSLLVGSVRISSNSSGQKVKLFT